jgi:endonuclease-3 related protein
MGNEAFQQIYGLLLDHFGQQSWWPGETDLEIIVGAILTQNTNWSNVTKAITNLREQDVLSLTGLDGLSVEELANCIRPSGYYNVKAKRLKNLLTMISEEYGGDLAGLVADDPASARENLLSVKGIGPETADSIVLYVCKQPVFVVDAYTHRVFSRHNFIADEADYYEIQESGSLRGMATIRSNIAVTNVFTPLTFCNYTFN